MANRPWIRELRQQALIRAALAQLPKVTMKRFCGPTCNVIVEAGTHCPAHTRSAWNSALSPRIRGRKLERLRAELFARQPLCAECQRIGLVSVATIRDHIIPLQEGGQDVPENTQGLCRTCHQRKSQAESLRGVRRHHDSRR